MTQNEIIAILRTRRKELGLTQARLGDLVGMKRQYIGMVEKGLKVPTVTTLLRICEALHLDVEVVRESEND